MEEERFGLVHSLSVLSIPTYYSDISGHANSVIDLIFLGINYACYDLKLKGLSNKTTLVLSNTRELDKVPSTK